MAKLYAVKTAAAPVVSLGTPETRRMPFGEWAKMREFFAQRDHKERVKKPAVIRRFGTMLETHLVVAAVRFHNGEIWRVDGHTRTEAWLNGLVEAPKHVLVLIYDVRDRDHAEQIYNSIDGREASKTSADAIFSAMHKLDIIPNTPLLRAGSFGYALNIATARNACRAFTKVQQVGMMAAEIKALDSITPDRKVFRVATIAAAFLTLKRYGIKALEFWRIANGDPTTSPTNAHLNLLELLRRDIGFNGEGGPNGRIQFTGRVLYIFDKWHADNNVQFDLDVAMASIDGTGYYRAFCKSAGL